MGRINQMYPQGSVLVGPYLFNMYLNDFFYLTDFKEVCNFAVDTKFHACDNDLKYLDHEIRA